MFNVGQRWFSEGEPELGLGIVSGMQDKLVEIHYPLPQENRLYNAKNNPLKRYQLEVGEILKHEDGGEYQIDQIQTNENIVFYLCGDMIVPEMEIAPEIDLNGPLERLMALNFDSAHFFNLRYSAYLAKRKYQAFKHKGFLGAQIRLLPHQVFVVN